ncbi:hypothetical protein GCM10010394_48090 [Streptomyces crystallinus]|uniref:Uncharacterized protein n=1 Tax=Streptomyces crystallinus TaxID=68191 RepID=A0ABP3RKZ3_9ACTN
MLCTAESAQATGLHAVQHVIRRLRILGRKPPTSWLNALRPGGRLMTTLSGAGLIIVADKAEDGSATGHVPVDTLVHAHAP